MKPRTPSPTSARSVRRPSALKIAVIGAGMAGITAARTLQQAGHQVTVFEKSHGFGGRMATRQTPFGGFDHGAQYFTVRDERFRTAMRYALDISPGIARPWAANAVRVLDAAGRLAAAPLPTQEAHWVGIPGMNALVKLWAQPLRQMHLSTHIAQVQQNKNGSQWDLHADVHVPGKAPTQAVFAGFDKVIVAVPSVQAQALLVHSKLLPAAQKSLAKVTVDPCWTLMLAFPNASQPGLTTLGPQWSAARSTHHRIAWLARETSKPMRGMVERWTVQASAAWSREHLEDEAPRVAAKLTKAFAEITGIRAEPAHAVVQRWRYAKTDTPLGKSHLWDASSGIGLCGDWCLGHRVEDAFVSGLELALAAIAE